ncbi:hypothetical protein SAY87_003105 [Trapa incisa]|uniref:Uncharacterized protein n=1 Tax=Trapa incisa TaxID=236973 RepID=A0AAN7KIL7_9MYRT|nr:hypothetical protein SAY87_003105 [Trapa incisa]
MLNPFICGSFHSEEEDLDHKLRAGGAAGASSRSSSPRRRRTFCRTRNSSSHSKNPYTNQGLDKFEKLLADINQKKKKKIFSKVNAGSISLVQYVPTSSSSFIPIVVKIKDSNDLPLCPPITEEAPLEFDKNVTRNQRRLPSKRVTRIRETALGRRSAHAHHGNC